ncbi:biopolymer transporter ExbD [Nannocystis bainbridge]|uniref:Biopolymer transporter ExbD n=1 Tax=Nannocystis bainbridge TaxID=2995303 RepID=A0ABT5E7R4_9BACT|nr:biopolymer transporter ExbD [Nannocystis bainbridge]MDC0721374.1 biopolymer transporter ExbD [Nannocystis bainbridge]
MTPEQEAFIARKKEKAAARRAKPEEKANLGITSLMDIVSILVVYLLKSYASDPVVINPTAGQKIPMSYADAPIQDGIPVFVTTRGITFDSKKIVTMTPDGDIDPSQVQNHLIGPLYDQLAEEVDKAKQLAERQGKPWNSRIILVGDSDLKFSVLVDVMYTTGRAEFAEYSFCVIKKSG